MVFKIVKSLFLNDAVKTPIDNDIGKQIAILNDISNGLGEYASLAFNEDDSSAASHGERTRGLVVPRRLYAFWGLPALAFALHGWQRLSLEKKEKDSGH